MSNYLFYARHWRWTVTSKTKLLAIKKPLSHTKQAKEGSNWQLINLHATCTAIESANHQFVYHLHTNLDTFNKVQRLSTMTEEAVVLHLIDLLHNRSLSPCLHGMKEDEKGSDTLLLPTRQGSQPRSSVFPIKGAFIPPGNSRWSSDTINSALFRGSSLCSLRVFNDYWHDEMTIGSWKRILQFTR